MGVGKGNGEGGGQFTSNLGPGWTRIAPHRKKGFQVSKRASVTKGVIKGNWQGELTRGVNRELRHMLYVVIFYIQYVSYYCVNVANKRIVFRL